MTSKQFKDCACKMHIGDTLLEVTLDNFSYDAKSADKHSSWCKACQKANHERKKNKEDSPEFKDFMMDGQGRLVHVDNVKEIDKIRDDLVRALIKKAVVVQKVMAEFKSHAKEEIEAFVELSANEYGVSMGGEKGNIKLSTYDKKLNVLVQIAEYQTHDERLLVAKKMIDDCLIAWTKDSRSEVRTLINNAFSVDKKGKFNLQKILGLRQLDIKDEDWQKAMEAVTDSIQVAGSKSYIRFQTQENKDAAPNNISLDFAAL